MVTTQEQPGMVVSDPALAAVLEVQYLRPLLKSLPPGGRTAVDAGAHRGAISAALAEAGLLTLAVEPNPVIAEQLAQKLAAEIRAGMVKVARCAASDRDGAADLILGSATTVSTLEPEWTAVGFPELFRARNTVRVPVRRLDWLAAAHGFGTGERLGLLKVDVEGHELSALRGFFDAGRLAAPAVVMFETFSRFPQQAADCIILLAEQGYSTFDIVLRSGPDVLEIERFTEPGLPRSWRDRAGQVLFYANVIAYHPSLDASDLPDSRSFLAELARRSRGPEAA